MFSEYPNALFALTNEAKSIHLGHKNKVRL